ncbi:hypothetical protein Q7P37_008644 [Cladosporium fusiforme]
MSVVEWNCLSIWQGHKFTEACDDMFFQPAFHAIFDSRESVCLERRVFEIFPTTSSRQQHHIQPHQTPYHPNNQPRRHATSHLRPARRPPGPHQHTQAHHTPHNEPQTHSNSNASQPAALHPPRLAHPPTPLRHASTTTPSGPSEADARIEEITELYATAQDEWEIAMEETEKNTTYAEDDRAAAREELDKVLQAYRAVVDGEDRELAEEVRRRIGQRVRELEMGVVRMEEMALEHD